MGKYLNHRFSRRDMLRFGTAAFAGLVGGPVCARGAVRAQTQDALCETRKGLVILVEFPDIAPAIGERFFSERFRKLDAYVREMSYGKVCAEFDFTGWHRLRDSIKRYSISPANLSVDRSRVVALI